jgi:hypothetical protein
LDLLPADNVAKLPRIIHANAFNLCADNLRIGIECGNNPEPLLGKTVVPPKRLPNWLELAVDRPSRTNCLNSRK